MPLGGVCVPASAPAHTSCEEYWALLSVALGAAGMVIVMGPAVARAYAGVPVPENVRLTANVASTAREAVARNFG